MLPLDAIVSDAGFFGAIVPTHACGGITAQQRYQPQTHPAGVRCSISDFAINVFAARPKSVWSANERKSVLDADVVDRHAGEAVAEPAGVCDYTMPGVDQQPTIPWLTYQNAAGHVIYGGRPLGAPPRSHAFG